MSTPVSTPSQQDEDFSVQVTVSLSPHRPPAVSVNCVGVPKSSSRSPQENFERADRAYRMWVKAMQQGAAAPDSGRDVWLSSMRTLLLVGLDLARASGRGLRLDMDYVGCQDSAPEVAR